MYYYPSFQSANHGDKLRHELARDLTRETAWEAVMRIRCGRGLSICVLYFFVQNSMDFGTDTSCIFFNIYIYIYLF